VILLVIWTGVPQADVSSRESGGKSINVGISVGYIFWGEGDMSYIRSWDHPVIPDTPELEGPRYGLHDHAGLNIRLGFNFSKRLGMELSSSLYKNSIHKAYAPAGYRSSEEWLSTGQLSGNIIVNILELRNVNAYVSGGYGVFGVPSLGEPNGPRGAFIVGVGTKIVENRVSKSRGALRFDVRVFSVGLDREAYSFESRDSLKRINIIQLTAGIELDRLLGR
jgi:hypothetical protein